MDLFLNPALLAGAGLAAAPIVLHLIMRQRPQHLQFPALRFIQKRHDVNRRQLRLRHLLLLLLRAAAVALLALALARPTVKASGLFADRAGPVAAAMIFDTLPHMDYKHDNQTRMEVAQHTALQMLARLPEESQIGVFDSRGGALVFQVDRGAARQRIERLASSGVGQPLPQAIEAALELLKTSEHPKEIYIFSDLAASSWKTEAGRDLASRVEQLHASVYLFDVGVEQPQDTSLGELRLSGQMLPKNTPLRISTDVSAVGMAGEKVVESYLVNRQGQPEKRGQESVVLAAGGSMPVEIVLGALDEGSHQGYLRILGEDGLAADNVRYFTARVRSAWRVLVIAPKPPA
ncbi:MAG TPA: VWA domain-containing protein, partial [Pirellulales bacterium]